MSARWVMAKAILDVGMNMGALAHLSGRSFEDKIVDFQIDALTAAGYRILAPGEVDAETVERCAAAITKANEKMPSIETPRMGGDNLAICLCSFFDDGDRSTEDDTGWSAAAREGYGEVTAAIKEHYATAIRSLGSRP